MKNLKWLVIGAAILLVVLISALVINHNDKETTATSPRTAKVLITAKGFVPAALTVKKGDTVTWKNNDQSAHRVASNPHPEHTDLKGLFSGVLNENDTYSFTYDKVGTFNYHDELNPATNGSVIVKD